MTDYKSCPYLEESCDLSTCNDCIKYKAYKKAILEKESKLKELNIDINEDILSIIFKMQKKFISKFHSIENLNDDERDYWIDKYLIAIEDEVGEAREFLNYYDDVNILDKNEKFIKEIIDILHFVVNLFIVGNANENIIKQYYLNLYNKNVKDVYDLFEFSYESQRNNYNCIDSNEYIVDNINKIFNSEEEILQEKKTFNNKNIQMLILLTYLLDCCRKVRKQINWKYWKSTKISINNENLYKSFAEMFYSFMDICISIKLTPKKIKDEYITKNLENIFRQELNY